MDMDIWINMPHGKSRISHSFHIWLGNKMRRAIVREMKKRVEEYTRNKYGEQSIAGYMKKATQEKLDRDANE